MSVTASPRRLFLGLWPSAAEHHRLVEIASTFAGKHAVKPDNLHLTLVFLGATTAERWVCYERVLSDMNVPALTLSLDCLGYWPKPRILWLGTSKPPLALTALVLDLNRRLEGCGFTPERRPFSPHITLARKFPGPAPRDPIREPIAWRVDHVVLAESLRQEDGTHYRVVRRWPEG